MSLAGQVTLLAQRIAAEFKTRGYHASGSYNAGAQFSAGSNSWSPIMWGVVTSDTSNNIHPIDAGPYYVRAPVKGRWRFYFRIALNNGASTGVILRVVRQDGVILAQRFIGSTQDSIPVDMEAEVTLDPGVTNLGAVVAQVFHSSGSNRGAAYGSDDVVPKYTMQYMGPAL